MGAAPILTILKDGEKIRSVSLDGDAVIGRDDACVIRLDGKMISRQHAIFRRRGDQVQIERKSDFAPILVNGTDCTQAMLKEGDVVSIGPYLMKLSLQQGLGSPAATQQAARVGAGEARFSADSHAIAAAPDLAMASPEVPDLGTSPELSLDMLSAPDSGQAADSPGSPPGGPAGDALVVEAGQGDGVIEAEVEMVPAGQNAQHKEAVGIGDGAGQPLGDLEAVPQASAASDGDKTKIIAEALPEVRLVFNPGEANVTEFKIEKPEISVGRGKDCDIILNDKKASRKNSVIVRSGLSFVIRDLKSSNGTFVNGEQIEERELVAGDKIRVGEAEFQFRADQPGYQNAAKDFLAIPAVQEASGSLSMPAFDIGPRATAALMGQEAPAPDQEAAFPGGSGTVATASLGMSAIAGIGGASTKPRGFMERFRKLPKNKQYLVIVLVSAFLYYFLPDMGDDADSGKRPKTAQVKKKPKPAGDVDPTATANPKGHHTFDMLTDEQKDFVRNHHKLAFEYFQHKDYANALEAIRPVFSYVDDYEDSSEIKRYSEDGVHQLKVLAEEKEKKDAEDAKIRKLTELINEARDKMEKKKYDEASAIFNDILVIDPENQQVAQWRAKLQEYEEDQRIQRQKTEVQKEINAQAWAVYNEGVGLRKSGKGHKAIEVFSKVKEIGASDARPARLAATQIKEILDTIHTQLEPLLKDGKDKEDAGDFTTAMADYGKALSIESRTPEAEQGLERVKAILSDRAKMFYTEAVLAESYSDFATAKKKFQQCMDTAPADSPYHDRAERKLARYFKQEDSAPQGQ